MANASISWSEKTEAPVKTGAGAVAWPTVVLFFALLGFGVATVWAALAGIIPLWLGAVLNFITFYVMEHVNHEAIHRNICGAETKYKWLNDLIGHVGNFWLFLPYPAFRAVHFAHHRSTNHPTLDCDMWFARRSPIWVALSCSTLLLGYEIRLQRLAKLGLVEKSEMRMIYLTRAVWLAAVIAAFFFGYGYEVFMLWILPALLAMPVLAFLFAFIVHHPHSSKEKYQASNVWLAQGPMQNLLTAVFLFQNYHLVHHLHPRVPFYRYGALFRQIRPQLEAKDASIRQL